MSGVFSGGGRTETGEDCPYRGVQPFEEEHEAYFFGREAETEIVSNNLLGSRITVLYGESGVGKSSLLRAAVLPRLIRKARFSVEDFGEPEICPVLFRDWSGDAQAGLREAIALAAVKLGMPKPAGQELPRLMAEVAASAGGEFEPAGHPPAVAELGFSGRSFAWTVQEDRGGIAPRSGRVLLIFDQLEEYFQYLEGPDWLSALVASRGSPARFLLSIREDSLALLNAWQTAEPNILGNLLRVEHLGMEAARDAVRLPLGRYNCNRPRERRVLMEGFAASRMLKEISQRGSDGRKVIQPAYLQLVLAQWWAADASSRRLKWATLKETLGGVTRIVDRYLETVLSVLPAETQAATEQMFDVMVTPTGRKIAQTVSDLDKVAPAGAVESVLTALGSARLIAPAPPPRDSKPAERCYEFSHDLVAQAAQRWSEEYHFRAEARRKEEEVREANRAARKFRLMSLALLAVLVLAIGAAIAAYVQYRIATAAQTKAQDAAKIANQQKEMAISAEKEATIARIIANIGGETSNATGLWELYAAPEDIRTAVFRRILSRESGGDLVANNYGYLDEPLYAAAGVDSHALEVIRREMTALCKDGEDDPDHCTEAYAALDGGSAKALDYVVGHRSDTGAADFSASMEVPLQPPVARRLLAKLIDPERPDLWAKEWNKVPWRGNEDLVKRALEKLAEKLRSGDTQVSFFAKEYAQVTPRQGNDLAVALIQQGGVGLRYSDVADIPKSWVAADEARLRTLLLDQKDVFDAQEALHLNTTPAETRSTAAALLGRLEQSPKDDFLLQTVRMLLAKPGMEEIEQVFARYVEAKAAADHPPQKFDANWVTVLRSALIPVRVLIALSDGRSAMEYPRLLKILAKEKSNSYGDVRGLFADVFALFAERYPEAALRFAAEEETGDSGMVAYAFEGVSTPAAAAREWISRLRATQGEKVDCAPFAPFVRKETLPQIMEVAKAPTCTGEGRRNLVAAVARVTGQDFAEMRFGTAAVDWGGFLRWAEQNGYGGQVQKPPKAEKR